MIVGERDGAGGGDRGCAPAQRRRCMHVTPLADVRIIAIEQYGAGPFGSVHLADLGAEVIKIEDPATGGDVGRYVAAVSARRGQPVLRDVQPQQAQHRPRPATAAGRAVFEDLVRVSDVVLLEPARRRAGQAAASATTTCKHLNPRIVCCSLSGFGMTGPRSARARLRLRAAGHGRLDGHHRRARWAADQVGPVAGGLLGRVRGGGVDPGRRCTPRGATGSASDCDISLFDTAISMLTYPAAWQLNGDFEPSGPAIGAPVARALPGVPHGRRLAGGRLPEGEVLLRLAEALGPSGVAGRPPLRGLRRPQGRTPRPCWPQLEAVFATGTSEHWLGLLRVAGVPCGPGEHRGQALRDPHCRPRHGGRDRAPFRGPCGRWRARCGWARTSAVTGAAPDATRTPSTSYTEVLGYDAERIKRLREGER